MNSEIVNCEIFEIDLQEYCNIFDFFCLFDDKVFFYIFSQFNKTFAYNYYINKKGEKTKNRKSISLISVSY